MTPLLGTKTPSALVGAKSGGGRRAARSLLSCALWSGMARLWRGMGGRRPPHRQHGLLGFHQPRDTQHGFPLPSGDSKESNPKPEQRVFTKHERRLFSPCMRKGHTVRNHRPDRRARRPVTAFLRVVARHGAAMARHGRPPSPAPATRPVRFSRNTNHETRTLLPRDNVVLPPGYDFFESLRFFCPTIPRNSSDAARAAVRVPSGVLARPCREWMGIELAQKIRAGERMSLLARMARFLRQSVPLCAELFLSSAAG